jgi:hypothetical protein
MKYEGNVTLVKYDDRPRMSLTSVIKKPKALLMTMIDDQDREIHREGKDTLLRTGARFKISGICPELYGVEYVIRITRIVVSDFDQTHLPEWALDNQCLDILRKAKSSGLSEDLMDQLVCRMRSLASDDARVLTNTMMDSANSEEFKIIPKEFRTKLLPFTGAFKGWPIGRMTIRGENEETMLWLENWQKASGKVR